MASLKGLPAESPEKGSSRPFLAPKGEAGPRQRGPHHLSMCEGLELPRDYILLMILIYTAYDIFCINEFPPAPFSLPPHVF